VVVDSRQAPALPASLSDDWVFERDLEQSQCRYTSRMVRTPWCPECSTVFRRWSVADGYEGNGQGWSPRRPRA